MIQIRFSKLEATGIEEVLTQYKPYRRITTFFDMENFLLPPFSLFNDVLPCVRLESFNGTVVIVDNCNCGYIGTGPRNTQKILEYLGVPREVSDLYICNSVLDISFDEQGNYEVVNTYPVFDSRYKPGEPLKGRVPLNKDTLIDYNNGAAYFLFPLRDINAFYNLLDLIEPYQCRYCTQSGVEDIQLRNFILDQHNNDSKISNLLSTAYILQVEGRHLDIVCLFAKADLHMIVNQLTSHLTGEAYFREIAFGNFTVSVENINDADYRSFREKLKLFWKQLFEKDVSGNTWNTVSLADPTQWMKCSEEE